MLVTYEQARDAKRLSVAIPAKNQEAATEPEDSVAEVHTTANLDAPRLKSTAVFIADGTPLC